MPQTFKTAMRVATVRPSSDPFGPLKSFTPSPSLNTPVVRLEIPTFPLRIPSKTCGQFDHSGLPTTFDMGSPPVGSLFTLSPLVVTSQPDLNANSIDLATTTVSTTPVCGVEESSPSTTASCYYLSYPNSSDIGEFFERIDKAQQLAQQQIHSQQDSVGHPLYSIITEPVGSIPQVVKSAANDDDHPMELSDPNNTFIRSPPVEFSRAVSLDHPYCENKNGDDFAVCREFLYMTEAVGDKLMDRQQSVNMEAVVNQVMQQSWFTQALDAEQTTADRFVDLGPLLNAEQMLSPAEQFNCQSTAACPSANEPSCSSSCSQYTSVAGGKMSRADNVSRNSARDDGYYRQQRDRNNEASRRSRQMRREKRLAMEVDRERLERQNLDLKYEVARLERLTNDVKSALLRSMATG